MYKAINILILLIFAGFYGFSQDHLELLAEGETDFVKLEKAFYQFYERTGRKESDLKKFERWKFYLQPRLVNGNVPGSSYELLKRNEYQDRQRISALQRIESNSWQALGPESWEVNTHGYSPGNGRLNAITVDPNNPNKLYAGSSGGGVWISENGGSTWYTTTDNIQVLGVTDIHVNPYNSLEVLVLTGDGMASNTPSIGILKSEDGGQTWEILGLEQDPSEKFVTYRKLQVDPIDQDRILVAGPGGIYQSKDAGLTWTNVIADNISDVMFHPLDPTIVYAAVHSESNESRLTMFKSEDGGDSWNRKIFTDFGSSFTKELGRKVIGVSPADPSVVYVLASSSDSKFGGFFKSEDELNTLDLISASPNILGYSKSGTDDGGQGWYDLAIAVDPTNANIIYTGGIHIWKSMNGGEDWDISNYWVYGDSEYPYVHADVHTLDIYNGKLYAGTDGGLFMSDDGGVSYDNLSFGMNIGQFYRLSVHPTDENIVSGGLQDNGSYYKSSSGWEQIYGADGMETIIDYEDPQIIYSASQRGSIKRFGSEGLFISKYLDKPESESGGWITPYIMHPYEHNKLYFGFNNVFKSTNQGNSLVRISNFDKDYTISVLKQHQLYPDHILMRRFDEIYLTKNEGIKWTNISYKLPEINPYSIKDVSFSWNSPEIIYITISSWTEPYKVLMTEDAGQSWTNYSEGLPSVPINALISRNDCEGTLYVGTDIGVYKRKRDDAEWTPLGLGLPNVVVEELEIQESTNTLFAATYGRGIWKIKMSDSEEQFLYVEPLPNKYWGDEKFKLNITSTLENSISISSLDPEIISIIGDSVTIEKPGETIIRVDQEGTCTIDIPITIKKALQTIDFNPTLAYPDTQWDFQLEASASSGLPVTFFSQNRSIIELEETTAFIQKAGTSRITVVQGGNEFYEAAQPVSRTIKITEDRDAEISIFPNPVTDDIFSLDIPKNKGDKLSVVIYDMRGQIVHTSEVTVSRNPSAIDISGIEQGIYFMKVGKKTFRFIKE